MDYILSMDMHTSLLTFNHADIPITQIRFTESSTCLEPALAGVEDAVGPCESSWDWNGPMFSWILQWLLGSTLLLYCVIYSPHSMQLGGTEGGRETRKIGEELAVRKRAIFEEWARPMEESANLQVERGTERHKEKDREIERAIESERDRETEIARER